MHGEILATENTEAKAKIQGPENPKRLQETGNGNGQDDLPPGYAF
jgi:hypothetical protein